MLPCILNNAGIILGVRGDVNITIGTKINKGKNLQKHIYDTDIYIFINIKIR
jgi:hypothetical protein